VIPQDSSDDSFQKRSLLEIKNVNPELAMFSTPPGINTGRSDYIYDAAAGEGITVYIIDTNFNLDHIVCILYSFFQVRLISNKNCI